MRKRLILIFLTTLLCIPLVAIILAFAVDPNRYKDLIILQLEEQLHHPVAITGDIDWQFWPHVGFIVKSLDIGEVEVLTSDNGFFADIEQAEIYVRILPLLTRKIHIAEILINNSKIYLLNEADKKIDWERLPFPPIANLTIDDIIINDTEVIWKRPETKTKLFLDKILMDFHRDEANIQLHFDDTKIKGNIHMVEANPPQFEFDFNIDNIDLDRYKTSPTKDITFPPHFISTISKLNARGVITIPQLNMAGLTLTQTHIPIALNNGIMEIAPLKTQIASGSLEGTIAFNMQQIIPHWDMQVKLDKVDAASFLKKTAHITQFTGKLSANAQVAGSGLDSTNITQSLHGKMSYEIKEGAFNNLELSYLSTVGRYLFETANIMYLPAVPRDENSDDILMLSFKMLTGNATIRDGISYHDFVFYDDDYYMQDEGMLNLITLDIDDSLHLSDVDLDEHDVYQPAGLEIPLKASGHINEIKIGLGL